MGEVSVSRIGEGELCMLSVVNLVMFRKGNIKFRISSMYVQLLCSEFGADPVDRK